MRGNTVGCLVRHIHVRIDMVQPYITALGYIILHSLSRYVGAVKKVKLIINK